MEGDEPGSGVDMGDMCTLGLYCWDTLWRCNKYEIELHRYPLRQSSTRAVHLCLPSIIFMEMVINFIQNAVYSTPIVKDETTLFYRVLCFKEHDKIILASHHEK